MISGYCMGDLLEKLRSEDVKNATAQKIHHGISTGYISKPPLDGSHRLRFGRKHISQVRKYLQNVPKPGRRKMAIAGA